jgi:hypothetical protein
MEEYPRNLTEFEALFATEEACREYLYRLRWPDGFRCPRCGGGKCWPVRVVWLQCVGCGPQTSVTAGTVFQDTRTSLKLWFYAMWWVTTQKNGASALGLQRVLGLKQYQTSGLGCTNCVAPWSGQGGILLTGRVEVDETYLGGLEEGLRGQPAELQKSRQAILPPGAAGGGCRARAVRRNRSADPPDSPKSITTSCRAYLSEAHTHLGLFRSLPTVSCPIDEAFRQAARNCATLAAPVSPRILHLNPQLFRPVQTWLKPLSRRR